MPLGNTKVTGLVLKRNGSLHLTQEGMHPDHAQRWADEGYTVFLIAIRDKDWAINHVNSGQVVTEASSAPEREDNKEREKDFIAGLLPHLGGR